MFDTDEIVQQALRIPQASLDRPPSAEEVVGVAASVVGVLSIAETMYRLRSTVPRPLMQPTGPLPLTTARTRYHPTALVDEVT